MAYREHLLVDAGDFLWRRFLAKFDVIVPQTLLVCEFHQHLSVHPDYPCGNRSL